jgi:hypothetical protein
MLDAALVRKCHGKDQCGQWILLDFASNPLVVFEQSSSLILKEGWSLPLLRAMKPPLKSRDEAAPEAAHSGSLWSDGNRCPGIQWMDGALAAAESLWPTSRPWSRSMKPPLTPLGTNSGSTCWLRTDGANIFAGSYTEPRWEERER